MEGKGRGRGESRHVDDIDEADVRTAADREAQREAARLMGVTESEIPIRGRGGFRQMELRTIPENVQEVRAKNLQNVRQVDVMCNYVAIKPMQGKTVNIYRVDFEPEIESVSKMTYLFRSAAAKVFKGRPIYDNVHECRSGEKLTEKVTTVPIDVDGGKVQKVKFTNTGTATIGSEMLKIYNVHMKECLRVLGFYQPQAGLYVHPGHADPVGQDIMMLRGYRTAANVHDEGKMMMNLEGAHKLVQRNNVLRMMMEMRGRSQGRNIQEALRAELTGKLVVTSYNKRVYRIEDVDFSTKPTDTFEGRNGPISFVEYFRTAHSLNVSDMNQPLLLVVPNNQRRRDEGDTRDIKLIPEFCNIAGLTEAQRNDNRLKFELIKASQVSPTDRVRHMMTFLEKFHSNAEIQNGLQTWGFEYDKNPVKTKAYVLAPTMIGFGETARKPFEAWSRANPETADFNVTGLAVSPHIKKMAILITRVDFNVKNVIFDRLKMGFSKVGLRTDPPKVIDMEEGDSPAAYINQLRRLPEDCTIAVVIMHGQNKERYDAIKKAATLEKGIVTQVVTARLMTDDRKGVSAASKIAIQIAAKVGGEPWWVDMPLREAMVCGYDTYHDTAQRGRSYGAFLASMNERFSRWYSKADSHDRLDEMSSQIALNMTEAVKKYFEIHEKYPERVFIYRDGVGEGQVEHVFKVELARILEALKAISDTMKLTMIIVNKRIGARFYMRTATPGQFSNCPPGTVVDHTVTRQERYDFFLISQSTRNGTVTPTYYNIIHDDIALPTAIHQKMAYKFCQLYYNWSGSVRVPAPCQYAHKLALLCGEHLHGQPNSLLNDRLHFL